jgi:hypothetical protein
VFLPQSERLRFTPIQYKDTQKSGGKNIMNRHVACMESVRNVYNILVKNGGNT